MTGEATTVATTTTTVLFTDSANGDAPYETLFDNTVYKKFTISFTEASFLKLIKDMEDYYAFYHSYRDNTIQEVDISYEDSEGNSFTAYEVGFRTKGNVFSRRLPVIKNKFGYITDYQQVSFQLEFNNTFSYPVDSTSYVSLKERELFGLEQLNFKFLKEDDFGVVTELVGYEFYKEAGVIASGRRIFYEIEMKSSQSQTINSLTVQRPQKADYNALFDDSNFKKITVVFTDEVFQELLDSIGINESESETHYSFALKNNSLDGTRTICSHSRTLL